MQVLKKHRNKNLMLLFFSVLLSANSVWAASDMEMRESYLRARAMTREQEDHSAHANHVDKSQEFHGVFYGYLPCNDCNGIKTTLSLKQNNNYLLVTQPARDSSREFYEKGKYTWNEEEHILVLTPRKEEETTKQFLIKDESTIIQLNNDGTQIPKELEDEYSLRRSDTVKGRQVHIH